MNDNLDNTPQNVVCNTCKQSYGDVFAPTQASGCASEYIVEKNSIYSHYCSAHDTQKFNVLKPTMQPGIICDNCIDRALSEKDIEVDESFDFWAPVTAMQKEWNRKNGEIGPCKIIDSIDD